MRLMVPEDTRKDDTKALQFDMDAVNSTNIQEDTMKQLLLVQNTTYYYQLKLVNDNDDKKNGILATVPLCDIRRANYRDEIHWVVNPAGDIISMHYIPLVSPLVPSHCIDYYNSYTANATNTITFGSTITYSLDVPGMIIPTILRGTLKAPPGLHRIPGSVPIPKGTANNNNQNPAPPLFGEDGQPGQPPKDAGPFSFFRRYWYIIVPLFIMNLVSGAQQPVPPDANETAPPDTIAGAPNAPTPVVRQHPQQPQGGAAGAAGSPSGPKQRRGKRG